MSAALQTLGGHKLQDNSVMVLCPAHPDNNPSLHLTVKENKLLASCQAGCTQDSVINALKGRGLWPTSGNGGNGSSNNLPSGIPSVWHGAKYVEHYTYRDSMGTITGYTVRYDRIDGGKDIIPFFKKDGQKWKAGALKENCPLYGLPKLNNPGDVLFCEGEKTTDAAQKILPEYHCLSWQGGCKAVERADYTLLKGRDAFIWPDADEPGLKAASKLKNKLYQAGVKKVSIVDVPEGVPQGWDLADALAEGWTHDQVIAFIERAKDKEKNKFEKRLIKGSALQTAFLSTLNESWHIVGILPESGILIVMYGAPGSYKSFIVLDMGLCIATGKAFHGHRVKQGTVIYIAAEGQSGILKRIQAWIKLHNIEQVDNFNLIPVQVILDDPSELQEFISTIKGLKPSLIVIDTLARCMKGDENSTADMGQVIIACNKINESTGAQIMLIHHSGKDVTKGARGSIALTGAADTMLITSKTAKQEVTLNCEKQKDYEPFSAMPFKLDLVDTGYLTEDRDNIQSLVPVHDPDSAPTKEVIKLSGSKRIAYEALQGLCYDNKAIHLDDWREASYKSGISASSDPGAKQKSFKRAVASLLDSNLIEVQNDYYKLRY